MDKNDIIARQAAKTFDEHFRRVLEQEFAFAPRIAQAILSEAQACLIEPSDGLRPGQRWVVLAEQKAGHGQAMGKTATKAVRWTLDNGDDDREVLLKKGPAALRRLRIQRLLSEALEQGALASQEDLATALEVNIRTIKRDFKVLQGRGSALPSRGYVRGIGRGQTHKAQIVQRWLWGDTYDQISLRTHHSLSSVQRYVQTFVRVIALHRQGLSVGQVAHLSQCSQRLVSEYLTLYEQEDDPVCRQRLHEQTERLQRLPRSKVAVKRGAV
jgi:hypothetical protein